MAKKSKMVVDTDESKLNMTPMIDITFLLVVFFMVTIDLSQKEFLPVELPFARQGVKDEEDPNQKIKRLVINLMADGTVQFKGETYSLSADNPIQQQIAINMLTKHLEKMHDSKTLREKDGASKIPVMIHGDMNAKWKYVQWIMQCCAHEKVKIWKIQFAVRKRKDKEVE